MSSTQIVRCTTAYTTPGQAVYDVHVAEHAPLTYVADSARAAWAMAQRDGHTVVLIRRATVRREQS